MKTLKDEIAALDKALDEFTNDCRARLHEMAARGKRGWDDPLWIKHIARDMADDARDAFLNDNRYHLHDIANRAMMLWWQKYRGTNSGLAIEPPPDKPKVYGCHCELEPGQSPDECVLTSHPDDCVHAIQLALSNKPREDCPYWREVKEEG